MSTTRSALDSGQLASGRWRLDASTSRAEFRVPHFWGLAPVKGRFERLDGWLEVDERGRCQMALTLEAAGERAALDLEATVVQTGAELGIDAAATLDQRRLGMTWSPLGIARTPTALTVHARLRREL